MRLGTVDPDMHTGPVIDLYLGADIGAWVLEQVDPAVVRGVFTLDPTIGERAVALGIDVEGEPQGRVALSVHYARVLRPDELARYTAAYNLHPSYLPWGRGWWAVFWAIYADEPAGASLHRMTARVDAGPLVDQHRVEVRPDDTGGSLLVRIRQAERLSLIHI